MRHCGSQQRALSSRNTTSAGLNACVSAGRISEANSILETMEASGLRPDVRAYNTLLKGLTGSKDLEAMERLLNDMRKRQISASVVTYNILVDAFAKEGRLEEVCIMFKSFSTLSVVWKP